MHVEFLVEEPSCERALRVLIPRVRGSAVSIAVHPHSGKRDLLAKLEMKLRAYATWINTGYRVVVLVDEDRQDCLQLKALLEAAASAAGLKTKTQTGGRGDFHILNRIAIEELEAWFFGDIPAMVAAYPGISPGLAAKERFRDPDAIRGGTWEALERVLQNAGHHLGGLEKIRAAREICAHMDIESNRSRSFNVFVSGLRSL